MHHSYLGIVSLGVGLLLTANAAYAEAPHLALGYKQINLDEQGCVQRGIEVMHAAGFADSHIGSSGKVVFGDYDDYHGALQCAPGMVFFVVSGPDLPSTSEFRDRLQKPF
jgi:hypothetical protein